MRASSSLSSVGVIKMADGQTESEQERKEKWTQVIVSLSVGFVCIVIGLPLWWHTTKVYRAPLPYGDIEQLTRLKLSYQVHINVLLSGRTTQSQLDAIHSSLSQKLNQNKDALLDSRVSPSYVVNVEPCLPEETALLSSMASSQSSFQELDKAFEDLWSKSSLQNRERNTGHYSFIILSDGLFSHLKTSYVGKHSHSLLPHKRDVSEMVEEVFKVVKNVYINEKAVYDAFGMASDRSFKKHDIESMRAQKSVSGYQISFTLLNSDPEKVLAEWDIQTAIQRYLNPFLEHFRYLDISVDSQVLHYSEVGVSPRKGSDGHYFRYEDLPHMINPVEAKLGSFVSLHPNLNFIVYVPPQEQSPVHMRTKDGKPSESNAFLSPQWGGILVYNVEKPTNDSQSDRVTLDTKRIMAVFISQLKLLLGVAPVDTPKDFSLGEYSSVGITDWEKTSLLRDKTMEYLATSTITLTSLAHLLEEIGNMVIGDQIQSQVELALQAIHRSKESLGRGDVTSAFLEAKTAVLSSEKAFFDPSILALLYFPDDQKYAIYIPLFLPISLPVLISLKDGITWLKARLKERNNAPVKDEASKKEKNE